MHAEEHDSTTEHIRSCGNVAPGIALMDLYAAACALSMCSSTNPASCMQHCGPIARLRSTICVLDCVYQLALVQLAVTEVQHNYC